MEPTKFESRSELPEPMVQNSSSETIPVGPEVSPNYGATPTTVTPVSPPLQQAPLSQTPYQQPSVPEQGATDSQLNSAMIADDADLIEKEWVLKAKAIVAQTAHDPNVQTKEVSKMKAEYLKKRYNKQLKIDES